MTLETLIETLFLFRKQSIIDAEIISLSDKVDFAIAPLKNVRRIVGNKMNYVSRKYKFYLLKDSRCREYVGIVLYMNDSVEDLHAYIIDNHRGQRILTNALKSTILPHILRNKEQHLATISDDWKVDSNQYEKSKKILIECGFTQLNPREFLIRKASLHS